MLLPVIVANMSCSVEIKGLWTGYKHLTEEDKKEVVFVDEEVPISNLPQDHKVYVVNGNQLRKALAENDSSVVYRWSPNCSHEYCILIQACQEYCKRHNYKLYVVADYFDMGPMRAQNVADFPMLIPNHFHYHRRYAGSVMREFTEDLLQRKLEKDEKFAGRFMIFYKDQLVRYKRDLYSD